MNQKYFVLSDLSGLGVRKFFLNPLTPSIPRLRPVPAPTRSGLLSGLNPLLLVLTLSLLSSFTSFAWDDDDNDSKPFHQSRIQNQESRIAPASANDYGYKNPYQANSTHRSSAIDFGGPKRLAQAADDDDSKPFYQSNIQNKESKITYTQPQQAYEASRVRALHVDTVQESVALRDRESKEMMAEIQRSFERQEAQQEKSRAQMDKQQEIYNKMDREEGEMAEFLGGVYKAKFGATTGHNSAITSDGYVFRSGNNFVTPKGIYTKTGNTYAGPGSFTTQTGTLFFGNESTTIQAGGAYFSEGKSGFIVSPNTSTWRTR
ncbi:MAG: hypothetical protein ACEQSM_06035 [Aliarcobacter sp.]